MTDLLLQWQALLGRHTTSPEIGAAGAALLNRWSEPHRRYHDQGHLEGVLLATDQLAGHADDPDAVRLAAWFHDAVYAGAPDDEENSALLAESELAALDVDAAMVAEVGRLIRMTAEHNPAETDRNGQVLSDADLAVLALEPQEYRNNTAKVRAEYGHVSDADFRAGRARIIRSLLAEPSLYRTPDGRRLWEAAARRNLESELAALTG
ncbi:metal-dependent phosphohydrolase [Mycolicibacterium neoaurum]|uniref:HD domain-containing protein n=1 Tax=Mycolicibacterium neoaurum TaxID=1795 RepID=UPI00267112F1|nr:metal-dependent phosphohydrolase [Mycolicibacterium neoaurum]MDO3399652.1 metal-dependent phosphohydrolase [Mycolicibacterium neoaurum]